MHTYIRTFLGKPRLYLVFDLSFSGSKSSWIFLENTRKMIWKGCSAFDSLQKSALSWFQHMQWVASWDLSITCHAMTLSVSWYDFEYVAIWLWVCGDKLTKTTLATAVMCVETFSNLYSNILERHSLCLDTPEYNTNTLLESVFRSSRIHLVVILRQSIVQQDFNGLCCRLELLWVGFGAEIRCDLELNFGILLSSCFWTVIWAIFYSWFVWNVDQVCVHHPSMSGGKLKAWNILLLLFSLLLQSSLVLYIPMYVHMYIYMYACMYTYIHVHTWTNTCIVVLVFVAMVVHDI